VGLVDFNNCGGGGGGGEKKIKRVNLFLGP